jgi:tRNA uridine 5-carboxymethylaminomethyl modification enzyme
MGGIMPIATDMSGIQYRTLNTRKGDAVQALRVQCDRKLYKEAVQKILNKTDIVIIEAEVTDLIIESDHVKGVTAGDNQVFGQKNNLNHRNFFKWVDVYRI